VLELEENIWLTSDSRLTFSLKNSNIILSDRNLRLPCIRPSRECHLLGGRENCALERNLMNKQTTEMPSRRNHLPRRQGTRKTTLEVAIKIHELHRNTELTQHAIASVLGINQGIVSKVLNGKLFPEAMLLH
jgi:predicted XRE-type DNA-binding protein